MRTSRRTERRVAASAPPSSPEDLALAATTIRALTVDGVHRAGIGHVGLPLGCAELGAVLFSEFLCHDPGCPGWPDRDRFVLSAGHGSMLLYSLLHLSGYAVSVEDLRDFRQLGSITPGHPEAGDTPGVEATTGPLGQGMGNAVGMALAERMLSVRLGSDLFNHRTYVLASDGDLMEGVSSEAASLAGHLGLGHLIVFYDDNGITIDGPTSISFSEDVAGRFAACGWEIQEIDGHDPGEVRAAVRNAHQWEDRPHLIICKTEIGRGTPSAGTALAHGSAGMDDDASHAAAREMLGWTLPPFVVPEAARQVFVANARRGAGLRAAWEDRKRKALSAPRRAALWRSFMERQLPLGLAEKLPDFSGPENDIATRVASHQIINALSGELPSLVGGSADLAGSNKTLIEDGGFVERGKFGGRNIHFGIREHAMAAAANGMMLHGGLRPYVATFMVFSDYMRPSLRMAALMSLPVCFLFSHDSIFVGEDGPTHQPVEQLAALRTIPNLRVWRPADPRETVAAWLDTLERDDGPSAICLTRQRVPTLHGAGIERKARRGGYLVEAERNPAGLELIIAGTGSEASLAAEAAAALNADGRSVRAVSMPCLELFAAQDEEYRESVLPSGVKRLMVEAGVEAGMAMLLRPGDRFHGMRGFGASAPYRELAEHFGFSAGHVIAIAREMLSEGSSRDGFSA